MNSKMNSAQLLSDLRAAYHQDPHLAGQRIQDTVHSRLKGYPVQEGRRVIEKIISELNVSRPVSNLDTQAVTRVFGLLLGRKVSPDDLTSTELLERLAQSLNTIFDTLNQLISVINNTLTAGASSGDQTIRQFIGYHLEGSDQTNSLEQYLGQINKAFLTTQEAFKKAAQKKVEQILSALNPESVAAERSGGIKIGPLRKAEDFEILKAKIERIQRWFDSGRFMEDFLREFEKNCQSFSMQ
ncbi:MAG: hypothetical protein GY874_07070 [Desulfobacteraceae bacterium]|nr:hypothetical protein [Desulfobacteraceae bacterium]